MDPTDRHTPPTGWEAERGSRGLSSAAFRPPVATASRCANGETDLGLSEVDMLARTLIHARHRLGRASAGTLALMVLVAAVGASTAYADPDPDLAPARTFVLYCGTAGDFQVVFVESGLGTFHVVGDSTSIFQTTSLTIEGVLVRAEPGFTKNGIVQLTCSFTGVTTGRHFTVTGFFTPPTPPTG